jgi:hypothetical protein
MNTPSSFRRPAFVPLNQSALARPLAMALLGAALLLSSGCVAVVAAAGAGTGVAWYQGRLEASVDHELDRVFAASQQALKQLGFARIDDKKTGVDARLLSRTALDKRVEITLQKVTDRSTKIMIRVGIFGDETLSMSILDKIKAGL